LFPTTSVLAWVRVVHFVLAAALFLTLSVFSLFLFTRTAPGGRPTRQKVKRNRVYRVCGIIILACLAGIAIDAALLEDTPLASLKPILWLETAALWAFGFSWLTKGQALLQD
jgi:heme A synthase